MVHNLADIRYNIEKANRTDRKVQNLACFIDVNLLKTIHYRMAKGKASGVDGVTKEEYEVNLDENLEALVARMKNGTYRPNPSRRVYIPKDESSKMRPLGISGYEDKLVENAVAQIPTQVYEPKFYPCSFGFRPGRNCHMAVREVIEMVQLIFGTAAAFFTAGVNLFYIMLFSLVLIVHFATFLDHDNDIHLGFVFNANDPLGCREPTVKQYIFCLVACSNRLFQHHQDQIRSFHTCLLADPVCNCTAVAFPSYSEKEQSLVDGMDPGIAGDTGALLKWCDRNQMAYQAVGMYSAYFDRAFRVYLRS